MTVGLVINVKDDIDLLRNNLAYHSLVGVSFFVLCDRGSSPEGREALKGLDAEPNIRVLPQYLYEQEEIDRETISRTRLAGVKEMWKTFAPDWLGVGDTDEFWVPRSGDIEGSARTSGVDHLAVERFNAAMLHGGCQDVLDRMKPPVSLLDQAIVAERHNLVTSGRDEDEPFLFHQVLPKFITTVRTITEVKPGFHDIDSSEPFERGPSRDLLILHLPFTTYDRFATKVESARFHFSKLGHVLGPRHGWHWRRWIAMSGDGDLRAEFNRQFFTRDQLDELRRQRTVLTVDECLAAMAQVEPDSHDHPVT